MSAVGCGGEGDEKDWDNGTDAGGVLQGNHTVGIVIWDQDLDGERGMIKVLNGFHSWEAIWIVGMAEQFTLVREW